MGRCGIIWHLRAPAAGDSIPIGEVSSVRFSEPWSSYRAAALSLVQPWKYHWDSSGIVRGEETWAEDSCRHIIMQYHAYSCIIRQFSIYFGNLGFNRSKPLTLPGLPPSRLDWLALFDYSRKLKCWQQQKAQCWQQQIKHTALFQNLPRPSSPGSLYPWC